MPTEPDLVRPGAPSVATFPSEVAKPRMIVDGAVEYLETAEHRERVEEVTAAAQAKLQKTPYDWQAAATSAILNGYDCLVTAPTSAGKTLPIILPMLVKDRGFVLILSPLNALQAAQEIKADRFRVIITSPEMVLRNKGFGDILISTKYRSLLQYMVVDEVHCVHLWGKNFRRDYAKISSIRAYFDRNTPLLALSATLKPAVREEVTRSLSLTETKSLFINLACDRPNIAHRVVRMMGTHDNPSPDLLLFIPADPPPDTVLDKFILFSQTREQVITCYQKACALLLASMHEQGLSFPGVKHVGNWGCPDNLSTWLQRAGRAGRDGTLQSFATLIIERSVFDTEVSEDEAVVEDPDEPEDNEENEASQEDGGPPAVELYDGEAEAERRSKGRSNMKRVSPDLLTIIRSSGCRRHTTDVIYGGPERLETSFICCDRCDPGSFPPDLRDSYECNIESETSSNSDTDPDIEIKSEDEEVTLVSKKKSPYPKRRGSELRECQEALANLRLTLWRADKGLGDLPPIALMSDSHLKQVASRRNLKAIPDLEKVLKPCWSRLHSYGNDVLATIGDVEARRRPQAEQDSNHFGETDVVPNIRESPEPTQANSGSGQLPHQVPYSCHFSPYGTPSQSLTLPPPGSSAARSRQPLVERRLQIPAWLAFDRASTPSTSSIAGQENTAPPELMQVQSASTPGPSNYPTTAPAFRIIIFTV
ncbi:hypothetical protein FRC05_010683 [Tulasnella sp. 425]|nr:hypothetical protein FRC05_010683 [Tulasnella sp. 425]